MPIETHDESPAPARRRKKMPREEDLGAYRLLERIRSLLAVLRDSTPHCNRKLHFDEYAAALVFYFFNPAIDSLRGLQQVTEFERVQKALGIRRMSLGAMSESVRTFDPELLACVYQELVDQAPERPRDPRLRNLGQKLTVVDGTVLEALPRMFWAIWLRPGQQGVRVHTQFEILKDTPSLIEVAEGKSSETKHLREHLEPDRLYMLDRGYVCYSLLQMIMDAGSSFVVRLHNNAVLRTVETKELSPEDRKAGVVSDRIVELGGADRRDQLRRPIRVVEIYVPEREARGLGFPKKRTSSNRVVRVEKGEAYTLMVATDRLDLPADVVGLIYHHRWKVELFFRVLKNLLGCRHLLSDSLEGVTIQVYCALIASLLLAEHTGVRPNKRVYELVNSWLSGWVTDEELRERLQKLKK